MSGVDTFHNSYFANSHHNHQNNLTINIFIATILNHQQHPDHGHPERFGQTRRRTATIITTRMGTRHTIIAGVVFLSHFLGSGDIIA